MAKETVRYPDSLVARIEAYVSDSTAFESKSEYHRFASEFLLSLLEPDHEPSVLGYAEIFEDLGAELDGASGSSGVDEERFLRTYIQVRRQLLHGEVNRARKTVEETYDVADREALLLDEFIGRTQGVERGRNAVAGVERYPGRVVAAESTNGRVDAADTAEATDAEAEAPAAEQGADVPPVDETPAESEH
jgi:Arc/MetJ-type ribon-helix-helix transcriptional regulator